MRVPSRARALVEMKVEEDEVAEEGATWEVVDAAAEVVEVGAEEDAVAAEVVAVLVVDSIRPGEALLNSLGIKSPLIEHYIASALMPW
mmetsp:Transcript_804/g.1128  ORF Transcript_804/g.1128 Transcript_804/m.1128 type:complete len:88 (+) Transcript_804:1019-1282(+)